MCFAWRPPSLKARIEVSSEVVWERDALFDSISTFLTCISASGLCAAASCRPLQIRIQLIVVVALIVFSGCPRACVLTPVSSRRCPLGGVLVQSMPCLSSERVALCAGCGRKISDRYYLLAVDKQWHMRCLKCCECKLNLESELTCFSKDGSIFCKEDYYRCVSVPACLPACVCPCARCRACVKLRVWKSESNCTTDDQGVAVWEPGIKKKIYK